MAKKPISGINPSQSNLYIIQLLKSPWFWIIVPALLLLLFLLIRSTPFAYFVWELGSTKEFIYNNLGFENSISTLIAIPVTLIYIICVSASLKYIFHIKRNSIRLPIAFLAIFFLFGSKPIATYLSATNFTRNDVTAQKCYRWNGSDIILSERDGDRCPNDPNTGEPMFPLTPEIAKILERKGRGPKEIPINGEPIQFFDPASGRPIVWYELMRGGEIAIFDWEGHNPKTGNALRPMTTQVAHFVQAKINKKREAISANQSRQAILRKEEEIMEGEMGDLIDLVNVRGLSSGEKSLLGQLIHQYCSGVYVSRNVDDYCRRGKHILQRGPSN